MQSRLGGNLELGQGRASQCSRETSVQIPKHARPGGFSGGGVSGTNFQKSVASQGLSPRPHLTIPFDVCQPEAN